MKKKVFTVLLTLIMIMALCACSTSAADEENKPVETTKAEETVEEKESPVNVEDSDVANSKENETINEEVNEFGVTESQIKDLYNFIESSVTENYLTVNNIESETFEWPAKEDVAWNYLQNLVDNYTISMIDLDEVDSPEFINYEVDENVSLLMKAVFNGMIDWHQEYFAGPSDFNNRADFQLKLNSVYPLNEFFIENVSFSNESTVETEPATEETGDSSAP